MVIGRMHYMQEEKNVQSGFNSDKTCFFFRELVFHVESSVRRKRICVSFDTQNCRFILKLSTAMVNNPTKQLIFFIENMLINNYEHLKNIARKYFPKNNFVHNSTEGQMYHTDDIVYLNGLPYRLEVEYQMVPDLSRPLSYKDDEVTLLSEPQSLVLMMVPSENSRFAGKFERLYGKDYYSQELLENLPILVTEAAARKYNLYHGLSVSVEQPIQKTVADNYTAASVDIEETVKQRIQEHNLAFDPDIAAAPAYGHNRLCAQIPVQAGLLLPLRHMELLSTVYMRRMPMDYAWCVPVHKDTAIRDIVIDSYTQSVKMLSHWAYLDLWQALNHGNLCSNRYLFEPDGELLQYMIRWPKLIIDEANKDAIPHMAKWVKIHEELLIESNKSQKTYLNSAFLNYSKVCEDILFSDQELVKRLVREFQQK